MGKATTLIGICLMISIVATLMALGIAAVDPSSKLLTSNALYDSFNMVYPELNTTGDVWTNPTDYTTGLPSREATGGAGATTSIFPDWVYSGLQRRMDKVP